ncbi:MAG: type I restriction enzyme S subunit [Hyphomonadaceae bacterium]|nr:MAG: type I restriction enzyme S subunit [Hyphomonadaceae bacterium]
MNNNNQLIPKLRFPEFEDSGDWEQIQLGSICELYQPQTLSASQLNLKGSYDVYGANGIIGKHDSFNHEFSEVVVTCRGATCGEVHRTNPKSWITGNAMVVKPKSNSITSNYLFQYFKMDGLKSVVSGSAQPQITRAGFSPFLIWLPKEEEQKEIADCLSSIDELIGAEGQKLYALKRHKKGLMQQLFPAKGQTTPTLRFPEFEESKEWEESFLGKCCKMTTGKLDANAMVENGKYRFYTCAKDYFKINEYAFDTDALLISGNGANVGYIHHYNGKFNAYQRTYVLDKFTQEITFIKYFLEKNLHLRISTEKKDGNTPYIVMSTLTEMPVNLPNLVEQLLIANFLTSIDSLINDQTHKIEALKNHKKGLMQQLFPSLEEVA